MTDAAVVASSTEAIRNGSQSFAAAARLFDVETRNDCVMLYAWCRHCDDVIDGQALGHDARADYRDGQSGRLERLRQETHAAARGTPPDLPVYKALAAVVARKRVPVRHLDELLDGFAMDVAERHYRTFDEVCDYAYHVAGVVGVMMGIIMGVRDAETLDRAADLGLAFQLTNIARDVIDDARAGRTYLPAEWLAAEGITDIDPDDRSQRAILHRVAVRLVDAAEPYYASAMSGMARLPWRSAWAIAAARRVYRAIGERLRKAGPSAWDTRISTSSAEKLWLLTLSLGDVAASRFGGEPFSRRGFYQRPGR